METLIREEVILHKRNKNLFIVRNNTNELQED